MSVCLTSRRGGVAVPMPGRKPGAGPRSGGNRCSRNGILNRTLKVRGEFLSGALLREMDIYEIATGSPMTGSPWRHWTAELGRGKLRCTPRL